MKENVQSVQSLSPVWLFATPWPAAFQASLSFTNSQSLLKLMSMESVMPSNHLILCHPLLLPPSIFPSIRVFSSESVLYIRWPMCWSFSFSISCSNEKIQDWFPLGWTGLISLQSKGLSRVFSNTTAWENVHHIANGHLLRKKMYLCKYLPIWYLELCYKSRAWAFSPLILIGKHQVGTISGPHFTERELTLGSLGKSPKVSSRVHSEVHLLFCNVKDTCVAGHVSEVKTTSVPQACSCGYSLLREQRRDQGTQQSWICHTSCS